MTQVTAWRCERCGKPLSTDYPRICSRCRRVVCPACAPGHDGFLALRRKALVCRVCSRQTSSAQDND